MIDSTTIFALADDLRLALDCSHPGAACAGVVLVEKKLKELARELREAEVRRELGRIQ